MIVSTTWASALAAAAVLPAVVSAAPQHHVKPQSWTNASIAADDFVSIDGFRLKDRQGTVYLTGLNYWSCMNLAADHSAGGNYSRFITELDQMQARGVNHLRIMAASEGAPTYQPFRMYPALQGSPGEYNEDIFVGLDRCLAEMGKRGMRATMTLANEWQWSGGFGQYVSWATNNSQIPYPSSWNFTAPPQRAQPGTGWGNYTVEGVNAAPYSNFTDYANQFYTISQAQEWYQAHIFTVLNRVNTVNGRKYKDDATVMTWQLANEPQPAVVPTEYLGPYSLELPPAPQDVLLPWIANSSAYIKSLAPNQLVNVGFEGKQGKWYYQAVHNYSTVDYGTTHCWVQNWGVYDMLNSSAANLQAANDFATAFIANSSAWSAEIGKPVYLEEFGMARDNWENEGKEYTYLSSASTNNKDNYFTVSFHHLFALRSTTNIHRQSSQQQ